MYLELWTIASLFHSPLLFCSSLPKANMDLLSSLPLQSSAKKSTWELHLTGCSWCSLSAITFSPLNLLKVCCIQALTCESSIVLGQLLQSAQGKGGDNKVWGSLQRILLCALPFSLGADEEHPWLLSSQRPSWRLWLQRSGDGKQQQL